MVLIGCLFIVLHVVSLSSRASSSVLPHLHPDVLKTKPLDSLHHEDALTAKPKKSGAENSGTKLQMEKQTQTVSDAVEPSADLPEHISAEADHEAVLGRPPPVPDGRPAIPLPTINVAIEPHFAASPAPTDDGSGLEEKVVHHMVESIWDLGDSMFWRMECPGGEEMGARYQVLSDTGEASGKIKYFFALDLTQVAHLLPRLMGTIVQVLKFLGPEKCALSIVEGRSTDGTYRVLHSLGSKLGELGVEYYLRQSDINPHAAHQGRIGALSILRNLAIQPLSLEQERFSEQTILLFLNDVALCPDDVLELLLQHTYQNATMTCAMDWVNGGDTFYDSWVSRSMSGNTFFEIPQDMSWAFQNNKFWDDPVSKARYDQFLPFQCFSCWGGMVTLDARPFQTGQVTFRKAAEGECDAGEPTLLAKDLHRVGLGRIATIPTVNVAYTDAEGARTKKRRGHVHQKVDITKSIALEDFERSQERIEWRPPPGQIKCMPTWTDQSWEPPF